MRRSKRLGAFTLIEMLVALALSGMLIVIINQQIQHSFSFDSKIKTQLEYRLKVEFIFDFLSADIDAASHLPNGLKSLRFNRSGDELYLVVKRFGVSPDTQQISGMNITWKFSEAGISRSVDVEGKSYHRGYSGIKVRARLKEINKDVINLIIETEKFTKSKLFNL